MNTFAVLFFFIQACFIQNAVSQCSQGLYGTGIVNNACLGCGSGLGLISPGIGSAYRSSLGLGLEGAGYLERLGEVEYEASSAGAFGGNGEGNVAVVGEMPVAGNTAVIGQVPILGAVSFCGAVPSAGSVSINGRSACECGY